MNPLRIIIINLLIVLCFNSIGAESINKQLTVKGQFLNELKLNLTTNEGLHSKVDQDFQQSKHLLLSKKSDIESNETNFTSLALTTSAVDINFTQIAYNTVIKSKKRRSAGRLFGYFAEDGKFQTCPEPKSKKNKALTKRADNEVDTTFWRCVYFSEDELKLKFNRQIQSNNGFKGLFGYFYYGKFTRCEEPKEYELDPERNDVKYIPFLLNYDSKCKYFENDPGQMFDAISKEERLMTESNNSIKIGFGIITSSVLVVSSLIMFSIV